MEQFTRQLAKEFGSKGITINAVAPGPVNTELFTVEKTEAQKINYSEICYFHSIVRKAVKTKFVLFLLVFSLGWVPIIG